MQGKFRDRVEHRLDREDRVSEHTTLPKADLGEASHIEVVEQLLQVDGQYLVDVGSGDGGFACALAERGANVLAIEPDERRTPPELHSAIRDRVTFKLAGGEAIPLEDGKANGVFFNRSLHHVPPELMDQALSEARRVLTPDVGFLYVVEPDMSGTWSKLLKPFHDETEVRRLAIEALDRTASRLFAGGHEYWYMLWVRFNDFEEFATRPMMARLRIPVEDVATPEVRSLFDAGKVSNGYAFSQVLRLRVYRGAA